MAGRGAFVSFALAFSLVLLTASVCSCLTVTLSMKKGILTDKDRNLVFSALQDMVNNVQGDIRPDFEYKYGTLYNKNVNLIGKEVVIRLTRWSRYCSASSSEGTEGRELLEAWEQMVPIIQNYLNMGHQWVSVSNNSNWIDYYVIKKASVPAAAPPIADENSFMTIHIGKIVADCTIQPRMMLSHHSALPFSQLLPGDSLLSPDYQYSLAIPSEDQETDSCVVNLQNVADGRILWSSANGLVQPQDNCILAFRSEGSLELWNNKNRIWNTGSACPSGIGCIGTASLAFMDGHVKLFKTVNLKPVLYWST